MLYCSTRPHLLMCSPATCLRRSEAAANFGEFAYHELECVKATALRPTPANGGSPRSAEGSPDEREEQRQDARDRKYRAQALLRDILCGFASRTGQRYTRKLVNEARTHRRSYDSQDDRDNQR